MSKIYTLDGDIEDIPDLIDGKPFFRKMCNHEDGMVEQVIYRIMSEYPHPNIVIPYKITNDYCDIELVNPISLLDTSNHQHIIDILYDVKEYFQKIGLIYIDWKLDNVGLSKDGVYKLFDFNVSGIINIETHKWLFIPNDSFRYRNAINNNIYDPIEIDNFSFSNMKN